MLLPGLPVATLKYKVMYRLQQMLSTEGWQHIAEIAVPLAQEFHIVLEQVRSHSTCASKTCCGASDCVHFVCMVATEAHALSITEAQGPSIM